MATTTPPPSGTTGTSADPIAFTVLCLDVRRPEQDVLDAEGGAEPALQLRRIEEHGRSGTEESKQLLSGRVRESA